MRVRWSGFVNVSLIPAPHQVAAKFVELLLHEGLLLDVYASTRRVFLGVMLGILAAVPVGFLLGWYRPARTFADPDDQFLPRAAADRADPAGDRLFRRR